MPKSIYLYIDLVGYKVVKIKDIKLSHNINEHSKMYIKAILEEKGKHSPIFDTKTGSQIKLIDTQATNDLATNSENIIFMGMVQTISIKNIDNVFTLESLIVSNTFQLDIFRKCQSFQDENMFYKDVIWKIIENYKGSDFGYRVKDKNIEKFTMQYEETDWEFLKRLASRFNQGLVPDVFFGTPKFTFGIPAGEFKGKIESYNYEIKKDIKRFMNSIENKTNKLTELDATIFNITTTEKFLIGDYVNYQNINLFVKNIEGYIENGMLIYNYDLCTKNGLSKDTIYNEKIIGLAIKGVVLRAVNDKVKVRLEIDKNQDESKAWKFVYTTMYTAEGNSGWYCMPEINDTVFIYFPNKEESNAVSLNSIREIGYESDKIDDPHTKYFRTANGKELKFAPDEIVVTCSNWSNKETGEKNIIYIKLSEKSGIEITSTKPISINSDSNINIDSKKKIKISASEEIKLRCKTSQILMNDMIDVASEIVRVN